MKKRITAGLLAIFLGSFGAHKFYLKKNKEGIIYLLFCWSLIPTIIGLIEGIIYLSQTDEKFNYETNDVYLNVKMNAKQLKILNELINDTKGAMILMFLAGGIPGIPYWIVNSKLKNHLKNETNPIKTVIFIFFFNGIIFTLMSIVIIIALFSDFSLWVFLIFFISIFFILFGIPTIHAGFFLLEQRKQNGLIPYIINK